MTRRQDRRVERTEQAIRSALLALLREQGFESLTVQQIIDRANVGRATFYAHFDGKDDLLVSGFQDLRGALEARQREALSRPGGIDDTAFRFSLELFAHANDHRDIYQAMAGKRSGATVQRMLHKLMVDLVRNEVKASMGTEDRGAVPAEALVQFIGGALFGLLMWWIDGRMRLSVEEVDALFRRLAIPALKAAT